MSLNFFSPLTVLLYVWIFSGFVRTCVCVVTWLVTLTAWWTISFHYINHTSESPQKHFRSNLFDTSNHTPLTEHHAFSSSSLTQSIRQPVESTGMYTPQKIVIRPHSYNIPFVNIRRDGLRLLLNVSTWSRLTSSHRLCNTWSTVTSQQWLWVMFHQKIIVHLKHTLWH